MSALDRSITAPNHYTITGAIQTDAPINRGNSGGPLLDSHGDLIGMNTAIYSPSGAYAGIGFAIPVDSINQIVPQIIKTNGKLQRPGLGIAIGSDNLAQKMGISGVIIQQVTVGGPADKAGLKGGDIIVKAGSHDVHSIGDLQQTLIENGPGTRLHLEFFRGGNR